MEQMDEYEVQLYKVYTNNRDISELSEAEYVDLLRFFDEKYHLGEEVLPSSVYDKLVDFYQRKFSKEYEKVGFEEPNSVDLPHPMGSLKKIKTQKELDNWVRTHPGPYLIAHKVDGMSIMSKNTKSGVFLYSRGGGRSGALLNTRKALRMDIPFENVEERLCIRGELVLPKSKVNLISGKKSARDAVSAFIRQDDPDPKFGEMLEFYAYKVYSENNNNVYEHYKYLNRLGFKTPGFGMFETLPSEVELKNIYMSEREKADYEMDGLVIYSLNESMQVNAPEGKRLDYAVAFKVDPEGYLTEIIGMSWDLSPNGIWVPTAQVKNVKIFQYIDANGNEVYGNIDNAAVYNARNVFDSRLGIGAVVRVSRPSDGKSGVLAVEQGSDNFVYPPGPYKWNDTKVNFISPTVTPEMVAGKVMKCADILDIKGMGMASARDLVENLKITSIDQFINNYVFSDYDHPFVNMVRSKIDLLSLMLISGMFAGKIGEGKMKSFLNKYQETVGSVRFRDVPIETYMKMFKEISFVKIAQWFYDTLMEFDRIYMDSYERFMSKGEVVSVIRSPLRSVVGSIIRSPLRPVASVSKGRSIRNVKKNLNEDVTKPPEELIVSLPTLPRLSPVKELVPIDLSKGKIYNPGFVAMFQGKKVHTDNTTVMQFVIYCGGTLTSQSEADIVVAKTKPEARRISNSVQTVYVLPDLLAILDA